MKISVSYLSSKHSETETIKKIDNSMADYIHVDLMDGKFVEAKNFTIGSVIKLLSTVSKSLDVHLMTLKPEKYFLDLATLNTEYITVHYEAIKNIESVIENIKSLGLKAGLSIKPETSVEEIKEYLPKLDQVLIMSVNPGRGGQDFMPEVIDKINCLNEYRTKNNLNFIISVDGGINKDTVTYIKDVGVDMIVSGSYICNSDNFNEKISSLK